MGQPLGLVWLEDAAGFISASAVMASLTGSGQLGPGERGTG